MRIRYGEITRQCKAGTRTGWEEGKYSPGYYFLWSNLAGACPLLCSSFVIPKVWAEPVSQGEGLAATVQQTGALSSASISAALRLCEHGYLTAQVRPAFSCLSPKHTVKPRRWEISYELCIQICNSINLVKCHAMHTSYISWDWNLIF